MIYVPTGCLDDDDDAYKKSLPPVETPSQNKKTKKKQNPKQNPQTVGRDKLEIRKKPAPPPSPKKKIECRFFFVEEKMTWPAQVCMYMLAADTQREVLIYRKI
jgi:hypothetical protein